MLCVQILAVFCTLGQAMTANFKYNDHCQNQKAQNGIELDELMGMWYGIEVFYHRPRSHTVEPRHQEATCPLIQLSRDSQHEISIIWQEPARFLEYYFRISGKPGVWISQPTSEPRYEGTVRVLKAVSTHMVLTFCNYSNHYSVLMSREKYLHYTDIDGVEGMLDRFNLTVYDKSRQCRNSAAVFSNAMYTIAAAIVLALLRS